MSGCRLTGTACVTPGPLLHRSQLGAERPRRRHYDAIVSIREEFGATG